MLIHTPREQLEPSAHPAARRNPTRCTSSSSADQPRVQTSPKKASISSRKVFQSCFSFMFLQPHILEDEASSLSLSNMSSSLPDLTNSAWAHDHKAQASAGSGKATTQIGPEPERQHLDLFFCSFMEIFATLHPSVTVWFFTSSRARNKSRKSVSTWLKARRPLQESLSSRTLSTSSSLKASQITGRGAQVVGIRDGFSISSRSSHRVLPSASQTQLGGIHRARWMLNPLIARALLNGPRAKRASAHMCMFCT